MILNTGSRTDIPAYYSDWFYERVRAGEVLVRNPYYPTQITRYRLDPAVVDALVFCTKNPLPMLERLPLLDAFTMFWFVTITPYGREIEPHVPNKNLVAEAFCRLSESVGRERVSFRYDPVFLNETYTEQYHVEKFGEFAQKLSGYTGQCVVSFIDLYEKTRRNFPGVRSVGKEEQERLIAAFSEIAVKQHLQIHLCCENRSLVRQNVDADGCLSQSVLERAIGCRLKVPQQKRARGECSCLLGADIGAYNTCGHECLYCYANYDSRTVRENRLQHDPHSPLLIGHVQSTDIVKDAIQRSWKDPQMSIFDLY